MNNLSALKLSLITAITLIGICFNFPWQVSSSAGLNDESLDEYLSNQFEWVIYINVEEIDHYLKYAGATLHPLNRVTLDYSIFERLDRDRVMTSGRRRYEQSWYHDGIAIGLRRRSQLTLPKGKVGAIIVENVDDKHEQMMALSNALVALSIDLQLNKDDVSVVMVPVEKYESIGNCLANYGFYSRDEVSEGKQMSINLRGYPLGEEQYFFLRQ